MLEDGYVQLGALDAPTLKGTIRIEFVNEHGLEEAGIDRLGVFKEFLEEITRRSPGDREEIAWWTRPHAPRCAPGCTLPAHVRARACRRAFDADLGLFRYNETRQLYPSAASGLADPNHLRMFDFVGKMIGKAIYEGIVLEAALADFFAAKLLGKHNSIDELRSLDPGLHSSLEVPPRTVRSRTQPCSHVTADGSLRRCSSGTMAT